MRKFPSVLTLGLVFALQVPIGFAGQLSSSLEHYKAAVENALANETASGARGYLTACFVAASKVDGLEAADPATPGALAGFASARREADGMLTSATSGAAGVRQEERAYNQYIEPYQGARYIQLIALQDQLLQRKYFKTEASKNSNFLEGVINGYWSLTRADHSDVARVLTQPHLGVSPWEAIFRLEPTVAMRGGPQAAIMGAAGLCYTFFPTLDRTSTPPAFKETFGSRWLKKSGLQIGVGAGRIDGRTGVLVGPGVQLNAIVIWGLYDPHEHSLILGISVSDLTKLKKVLGWFD